MTFLSIIACSFACQTDFDFIMANAPETVTSFYSLHWFFPSLLAVFLVFLLFLSLYAFFFSFFIFLSVLLLFPPSFLFDSLFPFIPFHIFPHCLFLLCSFCCADPRYLLDHLDFHRVSFCCLFYCGGLRCPTFYSTWKCLLSPFIRWLRMVFDAGGSSAPER